MNEATYQKLHDYLYDEHGVTLLESELMEIENIINPPIYPIIIGEEKELKKAADKIFTFSEYADNKVNYDDIINKMLIFASSPEIKNIVKDKILEYLFNTSNKENINENYLKQTITFVKNI